MFFLKRAEKQKWGGKKQARECEVKTGPSERGGGKLTQKRITRNRFKKEGTKTTTGQGTGLGFQ